MYDANFEIILFRPSSDSENMMTSSAHIMQGRDLLTPILTGLLSTLSNVLGKSAKKILNRVGLNMQPCLTPWFGYMVSLKDSPILIFVESWLYIFFRTLKNFPEIPYFFSL